MANAEYYSKHFWLQINVDELIQQHKKIYIHNETFLSSGIISNYE